MQRFPWQEVMRLGIGTYHLPPREFWNCTLRELVFVRRDAKFSRQTFADLMKNWPDEDNKNEQ